VPSAPLVTQAVTLGSDVWTTTYNSYPGSPAPTPVAAAGAVHTVIVGGPGTLTFNPPIIAAQPRDVVVFQFHQTNHTVTQSSFSDPCRKLNATGVTGFDSGFMPVAANSTDFPTWNYTVVDTSPVWGYCRQQNPESHCGQGMVFAINSVETSANNFAAFQNEAKALNGTAVALTAPNATTTTTTTTNSNGAISARMGGVGLTAVVIAMAAVLL